MRERIKRYFFISIGSFFLIIGLIGIFLPLLPTTPFLILTAICFNKGSDKFHSWLINHRLFGPPIQDWQKNHVIKIKYKLMATGMMVISSAYVLPKETIPLIGKASYTVLLIILLIFIWSQKCKSDN